MRRVTVHNGCRPRVVDQIIDGGRPDNPPGPTREEAERQMQEVLRRCWDDPAARYARSRAYRLAWHARLTLAAGPAALVGMALAGAGFAAAWSRRDALVAVIPAALGLGLSVVAIRQVARRP